MKIFLVGFMGSGKTTIGKRLAEPIGYDFVDTDNLIEIQSDMAVSDIFANHGEVAFRNMERDVLLELQKRDYTVVSTGGGMPCFNNNMDMMLTNGKVVYLKTSPQALARRLQYSHTERPLIKEKSQEELQHYITEKLAEREIHYSRAHIVVQTETFSMDELLQSLRLMKQKTSSK